MSSSLPSSRAEEQKAQQALGGGGVTRDADFRPPIVPCYHPFRAKLEPGKTYRWCACGRSASQPWCDDKCKPTDPQPIEFSIPPDRICSFASVCGCKYTCKPPMCDGSHIHVKVGYEEEEEEDNDGGETNR